MSASEVTTFVLLLCVSCEYLSTEKLYLSGGTIGVYKKDLVTPLLVHFPQRCVGWSHCKNTKYKIRTACKLVFHVCVMTSYIYERLVGGDLSLPIIMHYIYPSFVQSKHPSVEQS